MSEFIRWTVRGIPKDTIAIIEEIHSLSGERYGELVNEAIRFWYDSLPGADDEYSNESIN